MSFIDKAREAAANLKDKASGMMAGEDRPADRSADPRAGRPDRAPGSALDDGIDRTQASRQAPGRDAIESMGD